MKRYRHYKKEKAIILACFGSVIEQEMYLTLKKEIEEKFEGGRCIFVVLLSNGA